MKLAKIEAEFSTKDEAIKYMKEVLGLNEHENLPDDNQGKSGWIDVESLISNSTYRIEDEDYIYDYCISVYKDKTVISKLVTYKHPLIEAARENNLDDFKYIIEKKKTGQYLKNLAFEISVASDFSPIYTYIITNNIPLTNDPIYRCIYFDNPKALSLLLKYGYSMKSNWLIQAVDYNSKDIINEFVFQRKFPSEESLNTNYFNGRYPNYTHENKSELTKFLTENYGYLPTNEK